MSLPNSKTQAQKTGSDIGRLEATRKSARLKQMKLDGNVPGMDKSWSAALNRAQNCSGIQQSFLATARGEGRNFAGPRDIFKDPGLPKIALLVPKKEEPQDVDSDSDASVLQESENTTSVNSQSDSEVLAGDINFSHSVEPLQDSQSPSSSVNPNGIETSLLIPTPEKAEPEDAGSDSDDGVGNDGVSSLSLQIDSVFSVTDFHSVPPLPNNESRAEMLNSRLNDEVIGTTPTPGFECLCGYQEKFHELERVLEEKNLRVDELEKEMKEKNFRVDHLEKKAKEQTVEVDLLKEQIKNLQLQNARAGAKLLRVSVNQCKINAIHKKSPEVAHMEESPCESSSSESSDDEAPSDDSGVPSRTQTAGKTPTPISTQPVRAYTLRSRRKPLRTGDPAAISSESVVPGNATNRSEENSYSGGAQVHGASKVVPPAPALPTTSSCSPNPQDEHESNNAEAIHEVDEHLLRQSQFACICGLRFERKRYLQEHIRRQARLKRFQCDLCSKVFGCVWNLNRHLHRAHKIHPKAGFRCQICPQVFQTNKLLVQHKRDTHRMTQKPKTKDVSGTHGYVSAVKGTRRGHLCFCGKSYESRNALVLHVRKESLPVPFKCLHCGAQFSNCWNLKMHVRKCHDRPDYEVHCCYICGATFKNKRCLILHKSEKIHK